MKTARFIMLTIVLACITAFSVGGTVMCRESGGKTADRELCGSLKRSYLNELKAALRTGGYDDCGITLTKVTQETGPAEYTVRVHHRRIETLSEEGKEKLKSRLENVGFPLQEGNVRIEFYEPYSLRP